MRFTYNEFLTQALPKIGEEIELRASDHPDCKTAKGTVIGITRSKLLGWDVMVEVKDDWIERILKDKPKPVSMECHAGSEAPAESENEIRYVQQPRIRFDHTNLIAEGFLNTNNEPEDIAWFEESAELTKAICKYMRGKGDRSAIIEEMAHCYMVLAKLQHLYHIPANELEEQINIKYNQVGLPDLEGRL